MRSERPPRRQKDTLKDLNVRPSKGRGQNFLIRPEITESIVNFGSPPAGKHVVEIGPGTGAMTSYLAKLATERLTLIEIEPNFCEHLKSAYPEAEILNQDVRQADLSQIGSELYVFGNIPYVFSSEIIFHLIEHRASVKQAVLMLQKEFAERLAASPGGRDYGSISIAVQLYADVELGPIVPGDSFHPPTKVESQVMKLTFLSQPRIVIDDLKHFEWVVRAAFSQRRKKLINSLMSRGKWSKEVIMVALEQAGISPGIRAEQLAIGQFAALAEALPL